MTSFVQEHDSLITEHIPLVNTIVRGVAARVPSHVSRDDLTSAGLTALVRAAHAFDPSRNVPFAQYAAMRVRGALLDELRSGDWATRSVRRRAREVENAREQLSSALGRPPTTDEVATAIGVTPDQVGDGDADVARAKVLSLQTPLEDGNIRDLPSAEPSPEDTLEQREQLEYLMDAVAELPERLRIVISDYFLGERPMAEIAADLGVTESRISQMRAEALVLLRDAMNYSLDPDQLAQPGRPGGCADRRRRAYFEAVAARHEAGQPHRAVDARVGHSA